MIGERIKGLRLELGITQKELGEKIGVEKSTINKYELGKIAIPYKKIEKIAAALETTPASEEVFPSIVVTSVLVTSVTIPVWAY